MRLLQTQDVARRLGVATSTIRRWAAEGLLPFRWAGSYRVFDPAEVKRLARKLTQRTATSSSRRRDSVVCDSGQSSSSRDPRPTARVRGIPPPQSSVESAPSADARDPE